MDRKLPRSIAAGIEMITRLIRTGVLFAAAMHAVLVLALALLIAAENHGVGFVRSVLYAIDAQAGWTTRTFFWLGMCVLPLFVLAALIVATTQIMLRLLHTSAPSPSFAILVLALQVTVAAAVDQLL